MRPLVAPLWVAVVFGGGCFSGFLAPERRPACESGADCPEGTRCQDRVCVEGACVPSCASKCIGAADGCGGVCATGACAGCCDDTGTCVAVGEATCVDTMTLRGCFTAGQPVANFDCPTECRNDPRFDGALFCSTEEKSCICSTSCNGTEPSCDGNNRTYCTPEGLRYEYSCPAACQAPPDEFDVFVECRPDNCICGNSGEPGICVVGTSYCSTSQDANRCVSAAELGTAKNMYVTTLCEKWCRDRGLTKLGCTMQNQVATCTCT